MRIAHKLWLSFFIVVFLFGIGGFMAIYDSNKALKKNLSEDAVSIAVQIMDDIDARIYERIEHIGEFAGSRYFQDFISKANLDFEHMENIQDYINERDREWIATPKGTITPFMRKLIDNDLSALLREKADFYHKDAGHNIYGEIFVTNKYGANIAQTGKTSDYRQDDEVWWQIAKKEGLYIGEVAYDESSDTYSNDFAIRIDDVKGNFLGIIKVALNIEDALYTIKRYEASEKYKNYQFKLLTRDGKNIYSLEGDNFLADLANAEFYQDIKGRSGYFLIHGDKPHEGNELYVYARSKGYKDYKGVGWILVLEYKPEVIFAPINELNRRLATMLIGMIILSILISSMLSKAISIPLERLRNKAIAIGNGDIDVQIDIAATDEIGDLAFVISHMTEELRHLATTDRLTGVYNRVKFEEVIQKEMERAKRYGRSLSIAIFDLDYFKNINDTYGHSVGDYILKEVSTVIKKNIRATSYFFRWGGEEFVVLIPEVDLEGARIHAERLRKAVEEHGFGEAGTITASFGVAQFEDGDSADTFLKKADAALYKAKSGGRNRVEVGHSVA